MKIQGNKPCKVFGHSARHTVGTHRMEMTDAFFILLNRNKLSHREIKIPFVIPNVAQISIPWKRLQHYWGIWHSGLLQRDTLRPGMLILSHTKGLDVCTQTPHCSSSVNGCKPAWSPNTLSTGNLEDKMLSPACHPHICIHFYY